MPNKFRNLRRSILFAILALSATAFAQNPLIMPIPEQQFFTSTGTVCSGCFLYTYTSGTNTPLATYTDYTGLVANTNPILLNAGGYPQTAIGTQIGIWLSPTSTYRIVLQNAAHIPQWQIDGITGQVPNVLNGPLSILALTNQLVIGTAPNQTTLNFPAPSGNITITFPALSGTLITNNAPVITNPTINGFALTTPLPLEVVLFKSAVAVTHTGDLTEDTIWTATIPALSAASQIRVFYTVNPTVQDANLTTYRVKLNGVLVCIINGGASHANFYATNRCTITNRGATNSQVSAMESLGDTTTVVIGNFATTAIDTSVSRTLTITAQNSTTAANSQVFDFATVTLLP